MLKGLSRRPGGTADSFRRGIGKREGLASCNRSSFTSAASGTSWPARGPLMRTHFACLTSKRRQSFTIFSRNGLSYGRAADLWKGEFYRRMNRVNEYQITFSRNLRKDLIAKAINVNV